MQYILNIVAKFTYWWLKQKMRDTINFLLHVKMRRLRENVKMKVMPLDSESKNITNLHLSNLHWSNIFILIAHFHFNQRSICNICCQEIAQMQEIRNFNIFEDWKSLSAYIQFFNRMSSVRWGNTNTFF